MAFGPFTLSLPLLEGTFNRTFAAVWPIAEQVKDIFDRESDLTPLQSNKDSCCMDASSIHRTSANFVRPLQHNGWASGPFGSSKELVTHFEESGNAIPKTKYSQPLVLIRGDLSMRNAIVGDDGRFWLVDWTWSAF
ncbi:hypothetical protein BDP27DRAFT_1436696 [Rhodocollybia butyracea]|uniref:Aminoglycoside phosphotransferase domain-containing protein n=1 Tax=Rhodocollybia butyracea TaxID=206335 RepID=A0A9P5P6Y3_9AGAR|nr:hypothetical protein BDP27DRAFT_1436696 [Rhodocollybia butyracea]